ncbi:MAG TPA: WbqC family protein, partial [Fibrobacteria bacterium]|nr:WbqC family protein [Fibrobacteria bacterium]
QLPQLAGGQHIVDILETGLMAACRYFGLQEGKTFRKSSEMRPRGTKSDLILDLVETCRGTTYVTGLGARNYLDHEGFEARGIEVRYMDYKKTPYPQPHGEFTPFVSVLDLVANVGRRGVEWIHSGTVHWSSMQDTAEHHPTTRSDA